MTEAEWLTSDDPSAMLEFIRGDVSDRKLRLFAVACCRRIWGHITDPRCRQAVEIAEQHADGAVSDEVLKNAAASAQVAAQEAEGPRMTRPSVEFFREVVSNAADAAFHAASSIRDDRTTDRFARRVMYWLAVLDPKEQSAEDAVYERGHRFVSFIPPQVRTNAANQEGLHQIHILRDLVGVLPWHLVVVKPSWLTSNVLSLARGAYQDHSFDRLPILADALQDAGCDNEDILAHLRSDGPHAKGCWALDLILQKA